MEWKQFLREKVGNNKYPKLKRVRVGKLIVGWALIPLNLSFWMLPIGLFLSSGIKPSVWAIGRLNERKGNGDLKLWN